MFILKYALSYFIIIAAALPFIKEEEWWIRVFEFPRFQLGIIGIFVIIFSLLFFRKNNIHDIICFVLLTASTVYQFILVFPYTPFASKEVYASEINSEDKMISFLITNVLQDNKNYQSLLDIIKKNDPDLILAVETNEWWRNKLEVLKKNYPHIIEYPLENTYGIVFYSKLKLLNNEVNFLVNNNIPSISTDVELRSGDKIKIYGLHPEPPTPENEESDERDAELLIVAKEVKKKDEPVIVAGDLNDVAWSYTTKLFQQISGLLDPRVGRGFYNTFSTRNPVFRWPLDYVFHSNHFKLIKLERLPDFGSDHFPVIIHLSYEPEGKEIQKEKEADEDEKKEAKEKIEEGINDQK